MTRDDAVERLLIQVGADDLDAASAAVLRAAMVTAKYVTHECGTPAKTDEAILDTYREAIRRAHHELLARFP